MRQGFPPEQSRRNPKPPQAFRGSLADRHSDTSSGIRRAYPLRWRCASMTDRQGATANKGELSMLVQVCGLSGAGVVDAVCCDRGADARADARVDAIEGAMCGNTRSRASSPDRRVLDHACHRGPESATRTDSHRGRGLGVEPARGWMGLDSGCRWSTAARDRGRVRGHRRTPSPWGTACERPARIYLADVGGTTCSALPTSTSPARTIGSSSTAPALLKRQSVRLSSTSNLTPRRRSAIGTGCA